MLTFDELYQIAVLHKGSVAAVEAHLPVAKAPSVLEKLSDDRYLSAMSLRIFQAGLKHEMVLNKWPAFEKAFYSFDPEACAMLSDEAFEACMSNNALIRHMRKLKSIRTNAVMVMACQRVHGSFARWIANWPGHDVVALWLALKKQGAQLGGQSGARFLRAVGKDTFLLTDDVVAVLKTCGVVSKAPTSVKELLAVQGVFNAWRQASGRPLCEISRIVSMAAT